MAFRALILLAATCAANALTPLSPAQCLSAAVDDVWSVSSSVVDSADALLLASGKFARSVQGFAFLAQDNGNATGGGTNTDGFYISYGFDTAALPEGMCSSVPSHMGGTLCHDDLSAPFGNTSVTLNFVLGPADAVVFYGCTPPPVDYFGWDPVSAPP